MSRPAPVSLAYFGKIASRGDFVRSTQQGSLVQMLDRWLSQGLERISVDPRWKQRYDQLEPFRFAFLGVRSRVALAGHLIPSVDAAGRRFPFVTAGSFEVPAPIAFTAIAPMALGRVWPRLEGLSRAVCAAEDATASLALLAQTRMEVDAHSEAHAASFDHYLCAHTIGSIESLLRASHPRLNLRRSLLALGLLLQPVPASGVSRIDKGLALALPEDPLHAQCVAAFWLGLVTPFLTRGDFELALFIGRRQPGAATELCIGFAGGAPATLQAIFDVDKRAEAFVEVIESDWVDAHVGTDAAIKKLSSYLMQPQLSAGQAMATFKECFLGE